MTRVHVDRSIGDDLKRDINDRLFGRVREASSVALLGPLIVGATCSLQLARGITRHAATFVIIYGVLLVVSLATIRYGVAIPRLPRRWPFPSRVAVTIDDAGIAGTLDGRPIVYAWRDVNSIQDVGEALLLLFGEGPFGKRLVIPKAALPDPGGLWAELADRLVAKRGLTGPRTRTRIVNTGLT